MISAFLLILQAGSGCNRPGKGTLVIQVFPDSVMNVVSHHPTGINLNFLMDGDRFPDPERTVTEALREMGVKYLRYPGGEKSDLYLFSVPPYEQSKPALARSVGLSDYPGMITPGNTFTYDPLDFDEFMEICLALRAEPVVVVAADNYLVEAPPGGFVSTREELIRNAVEWVRYANLRKGYGIRYWMIGNECWNRNNPNSTPEIYARDVIDFSLAMKSVDPSILIIPNGNNEETFKTLIQIAGAHIDRLCVSNYGVHDFKRGYNSYRDSAKCLISPALTAIRSMNLYASEEQLGRWKVIVAEYGTIDWAGWWPGTNDMGHALVNFDMTGQLLLQPDVEFSCFWNTRWIENEKRPGADHDALDPEGNLNPTGRSLAIWGEFLGSTMVKSGSAPFLTTYASMDPATGTLFVYLINRSQTPERVSINTGGYLVESPPTAWELYGEGPEDPEPVWSVKMTGPGDKTLDLKGTSITVVQMKIRKRSEKVTRAGTFKPENK